MMKMFVRTEKTLQKWIDTYGREDMSKIFLRASQYDGFFTKILPVDSGMTYTDVFDRLADTQSNRIVLFPLTFNSTKDHETIDKMERVIWSKSVTLKHKWEALNDLLDRTWDNERIEQSLTDYSIFKSGKIKDFLHSYTDKDTKANPNTTTTDRADKQDDKSVWTYDNQEVDSEKNRTDYTASDEDHELSTTTAYDIHNEREIDHSNYHEWGHKGGSMIKDIDAIQKFLSIDVLDEYLNDVMPVFMYRIYE